MNRIASTCKTGSCPSTFECKFNEELSKINEHVHARYSIPSKNKAISFAWAREEGRISAYLRRATPRRQRQSMSNRTFYRLLRLPTHTTIHTSPTSNPQTISIVSLLTSALSGRRGHLDWVACDWIYFVPCTGWVRRWAWAITWARKRRTKSRTDFLLCRTEFSSYLTNAYLYH